MYIHVVILLWSWIQLMELHNHAALTSNMYIHVQHHCLCIFKPSIICMCALNTYILLQPLQIPSPCSSDLRWLPSSSLPETDLWHLQPSHASPGAQPTHLCWPTHWGHGWVLHHVTSKNAYIIIILPRIFSKGVLSYILHCQYLCGYLYLSHP